MTTYRQKSTPHAKSAKPQKTRPFTRDPETGRFIVQPGKRSDGSATEIDTISQDLRPDTFIEEFTAHPVVDRVMERLSR
jgi:hypothetical protein